MIYLDHQEINKKITALLKSLLVELQLDNSGLYENAYRLEQEGRYNEAIVCYKTYIQGSSGDGESYRRIALLYFLKGEYQEAAEYYSLSKLRDFNIDFSFILNHFTFLLEIDPINTTTYKKALLFINLFLKVENIIGNLLKSPYSPYGWNKIDICCDIEYLWEYFCDVLDLSYEIEALGVDPLYRIELELLGIVSLSELKEIDKIPANLIEKAVENAIKNYHNDLELLVFDDEVFEEKMRCPFICEK